MLPPNRGPGAPLTQWKGGGKGNDLAPFWSDWSSRFKAARLAEALTGHPSALDVRPVMSL